MTRTLDNVKEEIKFRVTVKQLFDRTGLAELSENRNHWRGWFKLYESESKNGLLVWDHSWYDHSSKAYGDVIDVMGYHIYGTSWRNTGDQFIEALKRCAELAGVEWVHITAEAKAAAQGKRQLYSLLTEIAKLYHSQLTPGRREFLRERYGLANETITNLKIGWATPDWSKLVDFLKAKGLNKVQILKTGLASETEKGGLIDFYRGRFVFPYWTSGRVIYFIARKTDQTPPWIDEKTGKDKSGKYIKQKTRTDKNPHVSKFIRNDYFYYEDAAYGTETVFITEGVTDCILANQNGFPCISPVTIQFKKSDWPRLLKLVKGVEAIYLAFDNEESESGERGALATARHLWEHGKNPFMVTIPRPDGTNKIDLNDFLREHGAKEFEYLLDGARGLIDVTIDAIEATPERLRHGLVDNELVPLLADTCNTSAHNFYCKMASRRLDVRVDDLRRQAKEHKAEQATQQSKKRLARAVDSNELPNIATNERHLPTLTSGAWAAIHQKNQGEPSIFRWANGICRVELSDQNTPVLKTFTTDRMRHMLARVANWYKFNRHGDEVSIFPPEAVIKDVLATPDPSLPILAGITGAPVFAPDGTLQLLEGYSEQSGLYYNPAPGLSVPDVPEVPTEEEVEEARNLVMLDILGQFPFSGPKNGNCERAHAAAMFIQPFVRPMIGGPTPLYLIEKPTPGTGATLMVQALMYPFLGDIAAATTEGRSEEEWRKRITAKLQDAPALFFIDNLRNRLDSSALASVITSQMWEDRVLGVSEMTTIQALCLWIATGNNPSVSQELKRRCVRIRMDAAMPDPHLRSGFKHPRLLDWVKKNRGKLIWSALTLVQNWLAKDRPKSMLVLGMFDDWAEMMGGILKASGIPGFLGNLDDFYQKADIASGSWTGFIADWWQGRGSDEVKTGDVLEFAIEAAVDLGDGAGKVVSLGRKLTSARDRQFNIEVPGGKIRVCLVFVGTEQNAAVWRLELRETYEGGSVLVERKSEAEAIADEIMGGEEW